VDIRLKRAYDDASPEDGRRVLVTRLWLRGFKKERADLWLKDAGPSRELLDAFHSGLAWAEYAQRYRAEMAARPEVLARLRELASEGTVTLMCSCHDEERCHRSLLREVLVETGTAER
jgi:uncharacterized protein YeaO (DUF488 family)